MDKLDRIFQLRAILRSRRVPFAFEDLKSKLQCSTSTLHRAIATLTDRLHAPLAFDPDAVTDTQTPKASPHLNSQAFGSRPTSSRLSQ
jgi:predicted DNA-binding transcriptional regulator YafY